MKKLKILLSFDHELSLGGAESYAQNLFDPTDRLLDLAAELDVPVTLFTDTCCAIRFREWDEKGFFRTYRDQILRAVAERHDVQLHLHPHWMESDYRDGRFIPAKTYSLGCFCRRAWPNNIRGIVRQSIAFLEELCRSKCPQYRCIAYRAGGFCLTPETPTILTALYDEGIRIESSIAKGNYLLSKLWEVDHRRMPAKANWYIGRTGPLDREASTGLYEIPITARPRTPLNNLPFLFKRVLYRGRAYRSGGRSIDVDHTSPLGKIKRLFPASAWLLGFDNHTQCVGDLMHILHHHLRSHRQDEFIACSVISHPKFMGTHALKLMESFVQRVRSEFGNEAEFLSYQQFFDAYLNKPGHYVVGQAPATG